MMIDNAEAEEIKADPNESKNMDEHLNYLTHHGVFKFDLISTKCRIAFDASAKIQKEYH